MIDKALLLKFLGQFDNLNEVVAESSARSIKDPPDSLFYDHQNVFIKSYLVSACSMLEAFIQDLAIAYVERMQDRINSANVPFNLIAWVVEQKKPDLKFQAFEAKKNKKDISELVSPNYWKTMQAFQRIGIDLTDSDVSNYKDFISATVEKRNKIVHHNDDALDLSFSDVLNAIHQFRNYVECLFETVCRDVHLNG